MADEEEVELTEEQLAAQALEKEINSRMPVLESVERYRALVQDDVEYLIVTAVLSSECAHSRAIMPALSALAAPQPVTRNAKFYRVDCAKAPEVANLLGISQTPTFIFTLKGEEWMRHVGSGMEKVAALFRNNLIKRNEVMHDYDMAKKAKPVEEHEEHEEEGEEAEEDE